MAQYDECVLLSGSHSMERELIARYMHDVSLRRNGPFVYTTATQIPEILNDLLSRNEGPSGISLSADTGTLFIDEVEKLVPRAQYNLFRLLTDVTLMRDISLVAGNTRITRVLKRGLPKP